MEYFRNLKIIVEWDTNKTEDKKSFDWSIESDESIDQVKDKAVEYIKEIKIG